MSFGIELFNPLPSGHHKAEREHRSRTSPVSRLSISLLSGDDEASAPVPVPQPSRTQVHSTKKHVMPPEEGRTVEAPQLLKVPRFLRYPGNSVRSKKFTKVLRQRLSVNGIQLGPNVGGPPQPKRPTTTDAPQTFEMDGEMIQGVSTDPAEELSLNPFTATYRNFTESSLKDVVIFLEEVGKEVESFAYRFLVEQHYHLNENAAEASVSAIATTPLSNAKGFSMPGGNDVVKEDKRQMNYFSMCPSVAGRSADFSAGAFNRSGLGSQSNSSIFHFGEDHALKSMSSMVSSSDFNSSSAHQSSKNNYLEDFPLSCDNNYFRYSEDWFEEFPLPCPILEAKIAVTTEPPIFFSGMLIDPVSEKYLFGGTTFYEEARVLKVTLMRSTPETTAPKEPGIIVWINQPRGEAAGKRICKVLLREYITLNRTGKGFIVQTFSIIDPEMKIEARRNQLVSPAILPKIVRKLQPGALTRAFSLQHVLTLKSLQNEAMAELRPPVIPDVPRFQVNSKKVDPFSSTSLFTSNIVRRYAPSVPLHAEGGDKKTATTSALWLKRRFRRDNTNTDQYAFLSDENPLRPIFETEMQQNPSLYVKPIDSIKAFLYYFKDSFSFYSMVQILFVAVRRLQRFFRYSLAKKSRAVARMLRLWRHLEYECRLKLQHYHPVPSSAERIDMIASSVLQPQMVTTREYKEALIQELWGQRREGYRKWCREKDLDEYLKKVGTTVLTQEYRNQIPQVPSTTVRGIVPFSEIEVALGNAISRIHSQSPELYESGYSSVKIQTNRQQRPHDFSAPLTSVEQSKKSRIEDEVYQLFGWYIEPEKLLYESHKRLLISLKESVLSMEAVQMEMFHMSVERAERRGAIVNDQRPVKKYAT